MQAGGGNQIMTTDQSNGQSNVKTQNPNAKVLFVIWVLALGFHHPDPAITRLKISARCADIYH
jgi:hypothetical protein